MADLPTDRCDESAPFMNTAMDFLWSILCEGGSKDSEKIRMPLHVSSLSRCPYRGRSFAQHGFIYSRSETIYEHAWAC